MGYSHPLRCEFCGAVLPAVSFWRRATRIVRPPRCPACEALARPLFVFGAPQSGVREVMISQHSGEPARKQLEFPAHTVVVFLDARIEILGLEIETKAGDRVLRWSPRLGSGEFRVHNFGHNYDNRDELIRESGFDHARLASDIAAARHVLRPDILTALEAAARG
jgi:hypothetical protein